MLVAAYVIVKLAKPLHCKLHFHTSGDHIRDEKKKKLSGTTSQVHFKNGRYSGKASSYLEIDQTWHLMALASCQWSKISMWLTSPATVAHCQVGKCATMPMPIPSYRKHSLPWFCPLSEPYSSNPRFQNLSLWVFRHGEAQLRHT